MDEVKKMLDQHDAEVRARAIDEFVKALDKHCGYYQGENKNITRDDVLKIAEQLKAGGKDD